VIMIMIIRIIRIIIVVVVVCRVRWGGESIDPIRPDVVPTAHSSRTRAREWALHSKQAEATH
jgi:hypothetical protein